MLAAKLMGLGFGLCGWLLWRQVRRALVERHVGPRHRRTHRATERNRYFLRVASRAAGALICLVAAILCLSVTGHRF